MKIDQTITPSNLVKPLDRLFDLAARKVRDLDRNWDSSRGTPVFTVDGRYTTRGWTEWTQGFQYGSALLVFDATGEQDLLDLGRTNTVRFMAPHVSHIGVHDHGFNNLSTYGNLRRLMREGRIPHNEWELAFYEMAIKVSGAVQAARWSGVPAGMPSPHSANTSSIGYIYSFNGPHSLFVDTMRTIRILGVAWQLGHKLMHENDKAADLLKRSILHGLCTNQY
ncbi:MAG: glycosyl hydrolase, partial [Tepidisphaerales bacterium]